MIQRSVRLIWGTEKVTDRCNNWAKWTSCTSNRKIFLSLLTSYRLEAQDNINFILGIFLTRSTMTRALWWWHCSWVSFTFAGAGICGYSVKLKRCCTRNLGSTGVKETATQNLAKFLWLKLNNVFFTCKVCCTLHVRCNHVAWLLVSHEWCYGSSPPYCNSRQ